MMGHINPAYTEGVKPLTELLHYDMHIMLQMDSKRLELQLAGAGQRGTLVASFAGCTACKAHSILTGGDWLQGAEERARCASLLECSRCQSAVYCNQECQSAHWPEHKRTCKPTVAQVFSFFDLGLEPSEDAKARAVAEFQRNSAAGASNTIPTYINQHGERCML